jgi:hypothetical protein
MKYLFLIIFSFIFSFATIDLSKEEKQYLKSKKVFNVCTRFNHFPLSGEMDGQIVGAVGDIFTEISNRLDIDFKAIGANSNQEFTENIKNNKCQLVAPLKMGFKGFDNIKTSKIKMIEQKMVVIGSLRASYIEDLEQDTNFIFYVKDIVHKKILNKKYPKLKVILEKNEEKIMQLIAQNTKSGYVQLSFPSDYVIQNYGLRNYKLLYHFEKIKAIASIGVNINNAEMMLSIIDKTLKDIGETKLDKIVNSYKLKELVIILIC